MKSADLNRKLVEAFPQLHKKYYDETSWQEGDSTGSHTVFGDVFTPYLVERILQNNTQEVTNMFSFLEDLLCLDDEYADEVIALSVFESIAYVFKERTYLKDLLGERSKGVLKEMFT